MSERDTQVGSLERVGIVVVHSLAIGVELICENVVIETVARAGERRITVGGVERPAIGSEPQLRNFRLAGAGEHLHHAGHGVGAVERALCAAHEFEAVGFGQRNHSKVESTARIVHRHRINDDLVVTGISSSYKERREAAALSGGINHRPR